MNRLLRIGFLILLLSASGKNVLHAENINLIVNGEDIGQLFQGVYNKVSIQGGVIDSFEANAVKITVKDPQRVVFKIIKKEARQIRVFLSNTEGQKLSVMIPVQPVSKLPKPSLYFCLRATPGGDCACTLENLSNSMIVKNPFAIVENQSVCKYAVKEYHLMVYRKGRVIYEHDFRKHLFNLGGENIRKILDVVKPDDVVEFSQVEIEDSFGNNYRIPSWKIRPGKMGWSGF